MSVKHFNRGARTVALNYQQVLSRSIVVLACLCALCVLLYSIFLIEAVGHAASQTSAQKQIRSLSEHLGDMESQYLRGAQSLTLDKALEMGYVMPSAVSTVFEKTSGLSLRAQ